MNADHSQSELSFLEVDQERIAYRFRSGRSPTIVFLPGYMSDMEGAKAQAVGAFAERRGYACLRLDYSGTGSSSGMFEHGTLDQWLVESLSAIDRLSEGPLVLAGSSMGGWLALLLAIRRPERVRAILGIAAAPDFTNWGFTPEDRERLRTEGRIADGNDDGSPGRYFSRDFWQSGQQFLLLGSQVPVDCPVRLVHGDADDAVPLRIATQLMQQLRSADVQLTIVKGGGHRLSAPHEIRTILRALEDLVELSS